MIRTLVVVGPLEYNTSEVPGKLLATAVEPRGAPLLANGGSEFVGSTRTWLKAFSMPPVSTLHAVTLAMFLIVNACINTCIDVCVCM